MSTSTPVPGSLQLFHLGQDVVIELVESASSGEEEKEAVGSPRMTDESDGSSSLGLDLSNFTGRLVVHRLAGTNPTSAAAGAPMAVDRGDAPNEAELPTTRQIPASMSVSDSSISDPDGFYWDAVEKDENDNVGVEGGEHDDNTKSSATSSKLAKAATGSWAKGKTVLGKMRTVRLPSTDSSAIVPTEQAQETKDSSTTGSRTGAKLWANLLNVQAVKKHVPKSMRQRRDAARNSSAASDNAMGTGPASLLAVPPPTALHELCGREEVTFLELYNALLANPAAVRIKDSKGRLPLHILGDNDALVGNGQGKTVATAFAWRLLEAYPQAGIAKDGNGHAPFITLIDDWVVWVYEMYQSRKKAEKSQGVGVTTMLGLASGGTPRSETEETFPSGPSRKPSDSANHDKKSSLMRSSVKMFPPVDLWDEVEWCFSMLSMVMDELAGKSGFLEAPPDRKTKGDEMREELAEHIVTVMPTLLKTVLLLESEGGQTRKRVLKMSIFRRILLCPTSVGQWVVTMLQRKGVPSKRAVDYLVLVSETTVEDYTGGFRTTLLKDAKAFHKERESVFDAIQDLETVISSLVVMETKETERTASTAVIWRILSSKLGRPFVVGLVLIDLVLHVTLMLAFRNDVQLESDSGGFGAVPTQVVTFICSHYFLRKLCEGFALFSVSLDALKNYFLNMWTLFDLMAIIMTLSATVWNDNNPGEYRNGFNAFVLGLLWIKVLGFLKVVNKEMSTFILALIHILADIKYFMVVFIVIIFMFGEMFHVAVSTKDDGTFCETPDLEGPTEDFCSTKVTDSYLRVYSMLIGDFELNDLKDTSGITTLFVIFTLIGVVILLNVLIAVISDSYERATISSARLFGRSRVVFVAQNEALENFLKPGSNPLEALDMVESPRKVFSVATRVFRWLVLLAIIATAFYAEFYLVTRAILVVQGENEGFLAGIFVLGFSVLLAGALWVVIAFAFGPMIRSYLSGCFAKAYDIVDGFNNWFVRAASTRLFGVNRKKNAITIYEEEKVEDDWTGRINYMESQFEKLLEAAKKEIAEDILAMEKRMYEHDMEMASRTMLANSASPPPPAMS